jgi:hypothetical protein
MRQRIGLLTLLVADDDEAIAYDSEKPGGALVEDTLISATRRWVVVAPQGAIGRAGCCWPRLPMRPNGAPEKIRTLDPRFVVWGHTSGSGHWTKPLAR